MEQLNNATTNTSYSNFLGHPELVKLTEYDDRIELIYKKTSMMQSGYGPPSQQVFKVIFSCADGKWNKSEPIYGKIIPAQSESYEFNNE